MAKYRVRLTITIRTEMDIVATDSISATEYAYRKVNASNSKTEEPNIKAEVLRIVEEKKWYQE